MVKHTFFLKRVQREYIYSNYLQAITVQTFDWVPIVGNIIAGNNLISSGIKVRTELVNV